MHGLLPSGNVIYLFMVWGNDGICHIWGMHSVNNGIDWVHATFDQSSISQKRHVNFTGPCSPFSLIHHNSIFSEIVERFIKIDGLPSPTQPPLCRERTENLNIRLTPRNPHDVTPNAHTFLKPFESHDMRESCNPPEPRLSREEGGWVKKVSMAIH